MACVLFALPKKDGLLRLPILHLLTRKVDHLTNGGLMPFQEGDSS